MALVVAALGASLLVAKVLGVVTTLAAKFILRETISVHRWAGTALVCLGVGLVSLP